MVNASPGRAVSATTAPRGPVTGGPTVMGVPSLITAHLPVGALRALPHPDLRGRGLLLRPWRPQDRDAVVEAFADPDISHWHARTMTPADAETWLADWPRRRSAETGIGWAVERADTPGVAGQVSLRALALAEGLSEISYWVHPRARGRGTAAAALGLLADWAFDTLGLHRLVIAHSTANPASCAVATRAGYALEGTERASVRHADGWHDMHVHALLESDPRPHDQDTRQAGTRGQP
ncbi:GNAT family N-acetyltransferase [Actinokineospora sp. G85]|uniref:GNAT family N-acetyltransferase n=1 Tax=Actinokineospora sp. G85 TaxID=3406626 RepID=UPI003C772DE6